MKTKKIQKLTSKLALIAFGLIVSIGLSSCDKNTTDPDPTPENSETARVVTEYIQEATSGTAPARSSVTTKSQSAFDVDDLLEYDFCFTFVYPVTLSYNNGTTVEINNSDELLTVAQSMTTSLYINGIIFPFDIKLPDGSYQSINNETEFSAAIHSCDLDKDGTPNYQDEDDDNDGVSDHDEDINQDGSSLNDDTDHDGTPNYQDTDDDNDGIPTANEDLDNDNDPSNDDYDNDGTPNYLDDDDDNDGVATADEDHDHDGNVENDDSDGDGVSDYLDTDSDNDGIDDGHDTDADGDGIDDDQEGNENDNDD